MPVGWNWTNSMSMRSAPASRASAWPSPVYSHEFEVTLNALPMPPVASTTALAREQRRTCPTRASSRTRRDAMPGWPSCQQPQDRAFHEDVDARRRRTVLQRADHLQAGAVADVRQPRVAVAAEVALQDAAVLRAVEERAPVLELPTRSGASWACSCAMRQLLRNLPPRIVSRKCTCQLSSGQTLPSAAATPPSAMTVCALPSSDLQTSAVRRAER